MSAEETVFGIDDLRNHIFTFLRSKPHKSCKQCKCVLEWDKGNKKCDFLEWSTLEPHCYECFRENFSKNYFGFGCSIC